MIWPTVALTGHRPQHLSPSARAWTRAELGRITVALRDKHRTRRGISGMALGSDMDWAESLLQAGIPLWPHIPYWQQPERWHVRDREKWLGILGQAARPPVVYGPSPANAWLFARNEGMINVAVADQGMLLAVWIRGKRGGTCEAIRYALTKGMRPTWVDPVSRRTWWPTVADWRAVLPEPRRRVA